MLWRCTLLLLLVLLLLPISLLLLPPLRRRRRLCAPIAAIAGTPLCWQRLQVTFTGSNPSPPRPISLMWRTGVTGRQARLLRLGFGSEAEAWAERCHADRSAVERCRMARMIEWPFRCGLYQCLCRPRCLHFATLRCAMSCCAVLTHVEGSYGDTTHARQRYLIGLTITAILRMPKVQKYIR